MSILLMIYGVNITSSKELRPENGARLFKEIEV